ncbi:MAG: DUF1080 domain-containing protein [Lentisphaerae bacterium]|nr:DUF1080 domain-containing protein [Lentisphaerota bacterium]
MKAAVVLSLALALPALAADKPLLGVPGKLVYENDLAAGVPEGWAAAKGKWEAADGALRGAELAADKHGAVMRMARPLQDFIIGFEVKLDGAKGTSLSINDPKGHLARIAVAPTSVRVTKDDHDKTGPDKAEVFGHLKADIAPGAWTKVRMEIVGDTMLAKAGEIVACGTHEQLAGPKSNVGLTVAGETASFRNFKVWEATRNPDWEAVKAALPTCEPVPAPAPRPAAARTPAPAKKPAVK